MYFIRYVSFPQIKWTLLLLSIFIHTWQKVSYFLKFCKNKNIHTEIVLVSDISYLYTRINVSSRPGTDIFPTKCKAMFSETSRMCSKTSFSIFFSSCYNSNLDAWKNRKIISNTTLPTILDHCFKPAKYNLVVYIQFLPKTPLSFLFQMLIIQEKSIVCNVVHFYVTTLIVTS